MSVKQLRRQLRSLSLPCYSLCGVRLIKSDMIKLIDRYKPNCKPQLRVDSLGRRYVRFAGYTQTNLSVTKAVPTTDHIVDNNKMVDSDPLPQKQTKPINDWRQCVFQELGQMTSKEIDASYMNQIMHSVAPSIAAVNWWKGRELKAIENIRDRYCEYDQREQWIQWNELFHQKA